MAKTINVSLQKFIIVVNFMGFSWIVHFFSLKGKSKGPTVPLNLGPSGKVPRKEAIKRGPNKRKCLAMRQSEADALRLMLAQQKAEKTAKCLAAAEKRKLSLFGFNRYAQIEKIGTDNPMDMKIPFYAKGRLLNKEVSSIFK